MPPTKHRMRVNVVLAVATFAALAFAQFPICAQTCIPEFGSGGDGATLAACGDSALISGTGCCINDSCDTDDESTAIGYIEETCGSAGLPVSVSLLQCAAAASSTAAAATVTLISTVSAKTSSVARTKTATASSRPATSSPSPSGTSASPTPVNSSSNPSNPSAGSSAAPDTSKRKPGLPVGAIAAISVGGIVLVIIIAVPLVLLSLRRRRRRFAALDDLDPKTPQYPELSTEANTHELEEKKPVHRAEMGADDKQRTELDGGGYYKYGWNGHQDNVVIYELDGQSHSCSELSGS